MYLDLQAEFLKRRSQHLWQLVIVKGLGTRLGEQMKAVPRLHSIEIIKQHFSLIQCKHSFCLSIYLVNTIADAKTRKHCS